MTSSTTQRPVASTPAEAFWTFDPFPLVTPGDSWHVNLDDYVDAEHYGVAGQLKRRLRPSPIGPLFVHMGVVGHKGTGKTTQVRQVVSELAAEGVYGVFIDAMTSLDQAEFSFSDLLLVMARSVVSAVAEAGLELEKVHYELVRQWFAEELLTEEHRKEIEGSIKATASVKGGIPYLAALAAKLAGVLKSNNVYRQEIRRRAERDPAELIRRLNLLLDAATDAISAGQVRPCRLTVIVDNLEKVSDRSRVDAAVLRRAEELRQLRCHLVLFFDPADEYAPITVQASQALNVVSVPMLPVRNRNDPFEHVSPQVASLVEAVLARRAQLPSVFAPVADCVVALARLSGGRLRDVLHLAQTACEIADPEKVTVGTIERAALRIAGQRLTLVRTDDWPRLAEIHRTRQVANDPRDGHLLLHLIVLNYNGAPWWDVHPLARGDERFEAAWKATATLAAR